jgi:hypothetical protein
VKQMLPSSHLFPMYSDGRAARPLHPQRKHYAPMCGDRAFSELSMSESFGEASDNGVLEQNMDFAIQSGHQDARALRTYWGTVDTMNLSSCIKSLLSASNAKKVEPEAISIYQTIRP